jgi:hypothetical protein
MFLALLVWTAVSRSILVNAIVTELLHGGKERSDDRRS